MTVFRDATPKEIDQYLQESWQAFEVYRKLPLKGRAKLMKDIADELENSGDGLIHTAMEETNLPEARLRNERGRTIFQLRSYADACERGDWLEARIDTALPERNPAKPDIRKMLLPLGPVVVFGASNFPFAYSTAGGDTACALAAGCSVLVKAHPAHAATSEKVALLIRQAIRKNNLPEALFIHVHGASFEVGKALVTHPLCKAAGFTGSFAGGKQLFDWANQRKVPIPVFAEMGSVNPVFLLPEKLRTAARETAAAYAASITLGVGQFCTNPGLLIGTKGDSLELFITELGNRIRKASRDRMLHPGIVKVFAEKRAAALSQKGVELVASSELPAAEDLVGWPSLARTTAETFLNNPLLHQEVFGPYSLLIECSDMNEMVSVARALEGQLTSTLMGTDEELKACPSLLAAVSDICGRLIINGVPTGVEVVQSMQHGGPYPATTDSRFTSVGADGIKRFARPLAFQNWPDSLLPPELQNSNPLGIWRTVDNELTKKSIGN